LSVGFQLFSGKQSVLAKVRCLHGKRSNSSSSIEDISGNILNDENEIISRWKEYFEDLLNAVKATNDDTHESICFGKE